MLYGYFIKSCQTAMRTRILGNQAMLKNLKFGWRCRLALGLPSRNITLAVAVKDYVKTDIRAF